MKLKKILSLVMVCVASVAQVGVVTQAMAQSTISSMLNALEYSWKNLGFYLGLSDKKITSLKDVIDLPNELYFDVDGRSAQHGLIIPRDKSLPAIKVDHAKTGGNEYVLTFPNGFKVLATKQPSTGIFFTTEPYYYNFKFVEKEALTVPVKPKLREMPTLDLQSMSEAQLEFSQSYNDRYEPYNLSALEDSFKEIHADQIKILKYLFKDFSYSKKISVDDLKYMNKILGDHTYMVLPHSDSEWFGSEYVHGVSAYIDYAGFVRGSVEDSAPLKSYLKGDDASVVLLEFPPSNKFVLTSLNEIISRINAVNPDETEILEIAQIYKDYMSLHPFYDGNGRTARALLDFVLLKSGYPAIKEHNVQTARIHWKSVEEVAVAISERIGY